MNIADLKQSLTAIADEAQPEQVTPAGRIDAVDRKVRSHRRNTVIVTVTAAVVAVTALAGAPVVLDDSDTTPPAHRTDNHGLRTVTEQGVSFYESPGGATLIAHAAADPGEDSVSVTFTPTTSDLAWTDVCYDAGVPGEAGAKYWLFVNGRRLTGASCQGSPDGPLTAEASFQSAPAANARSFERRGVRPGEPATFTVRITKHTDAEVTPQPVIAVFERGPQLEKGGVWFDRELVHRGHAYRVIASDVADLNGREVVHAQVDLPPSPHRLYVEQGTANVSGGLQLFPDSVGVSPAGRGVGATAFGELVPPTRRTAQVRAHPRNPDASGQIYVLVYEQID